MWFGDLVTMRWWDDLWLNESFATYLSFLALDEATRFTAAWRRFNGVLKPLAYRDDQLVTTHPIASDVADTDEAELGFDGITYEKGASVLKQLVATIGRDAVPGRHPRLLPASRLGQRLARGLPRCAGQRRGTSTSMSGRDSGSAPRR